MSRPGSDALSMSGARAAPGSDEHARPGLSKANTEAGRAAPAPDRGYVGPCLYATSRRCDKLWRSGDYGAGIIARSDALGTAIATLILGSSLAGAVVLALRSTAAVRSSGEAHWRALAMLAALLSVVLLSGVVAARP